MLAANHYLSMMWEAGCSSRNRACFTVLPSGSVNSPCRLSRLAGLGRAPAVPPPPAEQHHAAPALQTRCIALHPRLACSSQQPWKPSRHCSSRNYGPPRGLLRPRPLRGGGRRRPPGGRGGRGRHRQRQQHQRRQRQRCSPTLSSRAGSSAACTSAGAGRPAVAAAAGSPLRQAVSWDELEPGGAISTG